MHRIVAAAVLLLTTLLLTTVSPAQPHRAKDGSVAEWTSLVDRSKRPLSDIGKVLARATASVGLFRGHEGVDGRLMCGQAGALVADRTVPLETVALKRGQDRRCCPGLFAWRVDILDPDEPSTTFLTRLQAAGNGSEQRAEMQRARGRWRKPADVWGWFGHWPVLREGAGRRSRQTVR